MPSSAQQCLAAPDGTQWQPAAPSGNPGQNPGWKPQVKTPGQNPGQVKTPGQNPKLVPQVHLVALKSVWSPSSSFVIFFYILLKKRRVKTFIRASDHCLEAPKRPWGPKMKFVVQSQTIEFTRLQPAYLKSAEKIGLGKQLQVSENFCLELCFFWIVL